MKYEQCICRIRKPQLPTDPVYSMPELARLSVGFLTESREDPMTEAVRPYCAEIRVCIREIDLEKIRKDYHLTQKAHVRTCSVEGDVGICDPDRSARMLCLPRREVKEKYLHSHVEHFFVYQREPVLGWKGSDVPAFFQEHLEEAGSAFHCLSREEIHAYNQAACRQGWAMLPEEAPTRDAALFWEPCR